MLSKFSVKKPFTILVAVVIILVFGVISFIKMTPDLFPSINTPFAIVMTTYPGASPEEAEVEITEPMEQQLATLPNIKNVTSISGANYSIVSLEFTDDVNMDAISVDIRDKIDQIEGYLPEMAGTPLVMKINLDMVPVVTAAIGMEGKSVGEVSQFMKENLENPLEGIEGVASMSTMGLVTDNIQVVLSQDKIDEINDKVAASINAQMNSAESQIKSGINKANDSKDQVSDGKTQIKDGYNSGYDQLIAAKTQMEENKKKAEEGLEALKQFDPKLESKEAKELEAAIKALDDGIKEIDKQIENLSFTLSTQYSDLNAAESTITSTVNQLQQALSEVQSSKEAALASADMTGVLTMNNVSAILSAQNFSMPAGYVTDGEAEILVSVGDKIKDKNELENLILMDLGIDGIEPIRLNDIATVTYSNMAGDTYAKINGNNGVLVSFTKQSSYATAVVSDNIAEKFEALESQYDELEFTMLSDQGEYIHIVINSVLQNLLLGAIFAILILFLFLRDIRPTAITAISIPVSVIFAIVLMYFSGVTLNMISLSGLAIGVGMLVDNSIVVIENIYRLRSLGYSKIQSAVSGAIQVSGAITASTLTTICVFVPIVFVDGMTKTLFVDLALTVAYSLLASLIIALTLVPAMAKGLLKKVPEKAMLSQDGKFIKKYRSITEWSLNHKKIVVIGAVVLLFASSGIALMRGFIFMPSMSTPQVSATIQMPEDSTFEETTEVTDIIADEASKVDGVETVGAMMSSNMMSMLGMSGGEQDTTSTMLYIVLDEKKAENGKLIAKKMEKLGEKYNCEIVTSADMDMSAMMGGAGVVINLYGDDLDSLRETGVAIERQLNDMGVFEEVSDINEESTEELKIVVNKNLAMKEGLTVAQVFQQVSEKLTKESTSTSLKEEGASVDVVIENSSSGMTKDELEDFKLTVTKKDGGKEYVSLTSVADIETDASLNMINHDNQKRALQVTATLKDGENITHVTSDVKKMIEDKELVPDDVTLEYGGENEDIMEAMKQMLLMLLVGFILVYLIMVAQFQSLRSPFIIIFSIPLAFTGGMLALIICGMEVSVIAMMGFVMLMGIVVNNAIVLVDCINRFRLEGMAMDEAIITAGAVRMRPVLMTATTTILGLIPLAIGIGTGAEMVQPVAIVSIGGLLYATITTLVVIPIMYKIFANKHMEKIKEEELEIITV
ncbi:MAG: efflux RND transporter permease subunit [Firmicutes bacterium]|nr:efflux RND transporter permease subunit [Bacillota bacterium]